MHTHTQIRTELLFHVYVLITILRHQEVFGKLTEKSNTEAPILFIHGSK